MVSVFELFGRNVAQAIDERTARRAACVRERRCPGCGVPTEGRLSCWNPACRSSIHEIARREWPPTSQVIVTTGERTA